jgi:hypothetical protein
MRSLRKPPGKSRGEITVLSRHEEVVPMSYQETPGNGSFWLLTLIIVIVEVGPFQALQRPGSERILQAHGKPSSPKSSDYIK